MALPLEMANNQLGFPPINIIVDSDLKKTNSLVNLYLIFDCSHHITEF